jgi:hypothetical protein
MSRLRFDRDKGEFVPIEEWRPRKSDISDKRSELPCPEIMADIDPFISPLSDPAQGRAGQIHIDSRSTLREHLKENNCRIVEPSEKADFCGSGDDD